MENDMSVPKADRRFTVKNPHTDAVYAGIENVPGDHGNLLLAEPARGETRHWYNLAVGESMNLKESLVVVRVR